MQTRERTQLRLNTYLRQQSS